VRKVVVPHGLGVCDVDHLTDGTAVNELADLTVDRGISGAWWGGSVG
jgi:hypothetical protein